MGPSWEEKSSQDRTRQDKTGQDRTGQDKTRHKMGCNLDQAYSMKSWAAIRTELSASKAGLQFGKIPKMSEKQQKRLENTFGKV